MIAPRFSTSSRIEPACCRMVVDSPSLLSCFGMLTADLAEINVVLLPRVSSTRPFWPVRMAAPACSVIPLVSVTNCIPAVETETSPDDLLMRQESFAESGASRAGGSCARAGDVPPSAMEGKDGEQGSF